jgi:hypothetical protein
MSTELRQRKGGASATADESTVPLLNSSPESQTPNRNRSPSNSGRPSVPAISLATVQQYFLLCSPYIVKLQSGFESVLPYLHMGYEKYTVVMKFLEPYKVELLFPAFLGLILCFFGGTFITLVAVILFIILW